MAGHSNGKLVSQPLAEHGRSISDLDKIDATPSVEIRLAPEICSGNPKCGKCLSCNPPKHMYES